jgi:hypothetical protein
MSGLQLRRLVVSGPSVEDAALEFGPGLNVISGPSDTGKSYVVEVIDFLLGSGTLPRTIPESQGYERAQLSIEADDGRKFELVRSLQGGDMLLGGPDAPGEFTPLGAKLSAYNEANISTFLLRLMGLDGKQVRKNAEDQVQNLSFRNLAHLVVIDEQSIIKTHTPIYSGESTVRTAEASVFKLLLTGVDDSSLVGKKKRAVARAELEAQLALLDQLIQKYEKDLEELTADAADLPAQLQRLNVWIEESSNHLREQRSALAEQESRRQAAWAARDKAAARVAEIDGLLERFALLDEHYQSDLDRLKAVYEAGLFFVALPAGRCPLCGAPAGDHRHEGLPPDGDIVALREACDREILKIGQLRSELTKAIDDLTREKAVLMREIAVNRQGFQQAQALIDQSLAPAVAEAHEKHSVQVETRAGVRQALSLFDRIQDLKTRRATVEGEFSAVGTPKRERAPLPGGSLLAFSSTVENLLDSWHFPHEKPVYFESQSLDLVLGSRRRGEQGKGLRALTHAAFVIGLQQMCRSLRLPATGFVVLDSPLVTFREVDAAESGLDVGTRLVVKQAFYNDLAARISTDQVIVVENEDPESALQPAIVWHLFTGRADVGRSGFYPRRTAAPVTEPNSGESAGD